MSRNKFKGVLLDLDDTLYDYEICNQKALGKTIAYMASALEVDPADVNYNFLLARGQIHIQLKGTAASHNRLLYFQRMCELLRVDKPWVALDAYEIYWKTFLEAMELRKGTVNFLESIFHLPICLITDLTAHIQFRKIRKLKLGNYIKFLVTSEETGCEKPHPFIFLSALRKLTLRTKDCFLVGDNFENDIVGATNLGITAYWMNFHGDRRDLPPEAVECPSIEELIWKMSDLI
jgi:putative hydrolase of the HAD superfamily